MFLKKKKAVKSQTCLCGFQTCQFDLNECEKKPEYTDSFVSFLNVLVNY